MYSRTDAGNRTAFSGRGGGQEYIISVRQKINRGRRLAEDFILEASAIGKASEKLEEDTANLISKFRDKKI
ncbi:MAG: hypothetical protein HA490_04520 [Archaeoglobales archaeon]|nr:hypothetical protein [Archaeoglobales archaeon]